jgi:hypothetical protein
MSKLPGEFKFADYFGFASAGAIGVVAAIIVDMTQSADTSTLFFLSRWFDALTSLIGLDQIPLYGIILILMGLGAMSVFYFQPVTMRGAFVQGFSVLAAVMTLAPAELSKPLDAPMMDVDDSEPAVASLEPKARLASYVGSMGGVNFQPHLQPAVYTPGAQPAIQTVAAIQDERQQRYNLTIEIDFPDGLRQDYKNMVQRGRLRGKLHNKNTRQTFDLFRSGNRVSAQGNKLIIRTSIAGTDATAELYARVEAVGYSINEEKFDARLGNNVTWKINMTPSRTPIFLQRLNKSYWF